MFIMLSASLLIANAAPTTAIPTPASKKLNKIICKNEQLTGSRLSFARVCQTQRAWDERADEDAKALRDMQSKVISPR